MDLSNLTRIENTAGTFHLTWVINNICTQHCDYCPSLLNAGKNHHYNWDDARKFAEKIAIEHDSLEIMVDKFKECNDVLSSSLELKDQYKVALDKSEQVSDMLRKEGDKKDRIIKGYQTIDESQQKIIGELHNEFRKSRNRNKWLTGLSLGGVSVGFTSIILLLIK